MTKLLFILLLVFGCSTIEKDDSGCEDCCAHCNKEVGGWIVAEGNLEYHEECYIHNIAPKCSECSLPIYNEEAIFSQENKNIKYHTGCFVFPECSVCKSPMHGNGLIDFWGNKYHVEHEVNGTCGSCHRIISRNTTNDGKNLFDGRKICNICDLTSVKNLWNLAKSIVSVLRVLEEKGFKNLPLSVPVQLISLTEMKAKYSKYSNSTIAHAEGYAQGLTTYSKRNGKIDQSSFTIYILNNLPLVEFEAILAHEYLHVWMALNNLEYSHTKTEGFCELGSALIYNDYAKYSFNESREFSEIKLKIMKQNNVDAYGIGYNKMNNCLNELGWSSLIEKMLNNQYLYCY